MILGAHVSAQGGVDNAPANAAELGITAIQIFTKNQRQWKAKPLGEDTIARYHEQVKEHGITHAVSHVSYLINLCAPDDEKRQKSIDAMVDELERAEALGLSHAVVHPGSHLKQGEEWGVKEIATSLDIVHKRTSGFKVKIALENTAGQGTNLGYRFEQLAGMIERTKESDRLAVCYDTCHGFSAGYDLTSEAEYGKVWDEFDRIVGLGRIQVFHINDTKKDLGSRVDRHDQIGDGKLGLEPFRYLLNDKRFSEVPAILETPQGEDGYPKDLKELRALITGKTSR